MTGDRKPTWRFAPTGGGAEQGNNAGQTLFANDALQQMVRETLQNSLDHHQDGLEGVHVQYRMFNLGTNEFGGPELAGHIQQAQREASRHKDPDTLDQYERMNQILHRPYVTCLAVQDSNTTGLKGDNWANLILREGVPTIAPGETHGGSYGYGKYAAFNISQINTVIYSTRYVDKAAMGRVTKMIGRSQLRSHDDPGDPSKRLQNVGFYGLHEEGPEPPAHGT